MKCLEISSYHCREIYVAVTHVGAMTKITLLKNKIDSQNVCFTIRLFHASTCFEHMCSEHVQAWNKLIVKQKCCALSWLITDINYKGVSAAKHSSLCFLEKHTFECHNTITLILTNNKNNQLFPLFIKSDPK